MDTLLETLLDALAALWSLVTDAVCRPVHALGWIAALVLVAGPLGVFAADGGSDLGWVMLAAFAASGLLGFAAAVLAVGVLVRSAVSLARRILRRRAGGAA